jgi:nicotinate-nucleotide adenylyltransferase
MVTSARKVGLYGGAFDPPHLGHVVVAVEAAWQLGLDEVRLLPVGIPVHRGAPRADARTRVDLVVAAVADFPDIQVSTIETDRTEPSFTIDTLRALAADEPGVEWTVIVGADQVEVFDTWREPQSIVALARLGVVARAETDAAEAAASARKHAPGRFDVISIPRIDISSTLVRARIAAGEPFSHLVPAAVAQMIADRGLYGR